MKLIFLTAVLVSAAWGAKLGSRIIGGREANAGEFPFVVAIYKQTAQGNYFCAGALLSNQWVITSGSCVADALLFQIRLGANSLDSSAAVRVATDSYFLHPDFDALTLNNDLGLIKLRLPISYTDYIQPVSFPARDVQAYAVVTAVGWGQTSDSNPGLTDELQTVTLTSLSNEECRLYFGNQITDSMVCVDGNYNQGTCNGDTGGPLVQYVNGHKATIVGISSFISGKGCESTDPSGYTRTYAYIDWVNNVTASN